jgi:diguanylate cyclase (GGDEF)-like protein
MSHEIPNVAASALLPILEIAFDGIAILEPPSWRIAYANPTLRGWLRRSIDTADDAFVEGIVRPTYREDLRHQLAASLERDESRPGPAFALQLNVPGAEVLSARICRLVIGDRSCVGIVMKSPRVTSSIAKLDEMRCDPLTQLPDRNFLLARLSARLQGDRAADRKFAVLFVDLNSFKQINDEHGHLLGDRVLREVADRLVTCVRQGDYVTRFGGDEFVILVEHIEGPEEIAPVVSRIHDSFAQPIVLPEGTFPLSLSIGATQAGAHHRTADHILADADRAMYAAKRATI